MGRDWEFFNNFEKRHKEKMLKKLSPNKSFRIFSEMYEFAVNSGMVDTKASDLKRTFFLAEIHSILNKVK